jgi:hypothetical protein
MILIESKIRAGMKWMLAGIPMQKAGTGAKISNKFQAMLKRIAIAE